MNTRVKKVTKAFTLLEILLVIAAIGILAAIVLIAINPTRQIAQVRNAQRRSDINTIYKALEQYLIDNKTYPTDITDSKKVICDTGSKTTADTLDPTNLCDGKVDLRVLVPTYIAAIPKDPSGLVYEVYKNPANNRIGVEAPGVELGQSIAVNPISTTPAPTPTPTPALGITSCPTGYIPVPGNSLYDTNNFCVMKYEAKAVDINNPTVGLKDPVTSSGSTLSNTIADNVIATTAANNRAIASVASGYPIGNISRATAATYCTTAGASLITNKEWMTIARNIESQLSNWTTGTEASTAIGIGSLYRGHSDKVPPNALEAGPDNDGYIGTGQSGFNIERRTHSLSNGEIIWDMSGNSWDMTDNSIMGVDKPNHNLVGQWQDWTSISDYGPSLSYDLTRPSNNTWNSNQNMGQYAKGDSTGGPFVFLRGGDWRTITDTQPSLSGIFALALFISDPSEMDALGFRCVIR